MSDIAGLGAAPGRPLAIAMVIASSAAWGGATVMSKGVLEFVPPFTLLAIQLAASVTFLWTVVIVRRLSLGRPRAALRAALSGLLEPGLAYAFGVPGLALTTAGNASLLAALEPACVVAFVWLGFGRRPGRRIVIALGAALTGVVLVTSGDLGSAGAGDPLGDLLVLLATAFAALYVVTSSRLLAAHDPLALSALQQSCGLVFILVLLAGVHAAGIETVALPPLPVFAAAALSGIVQYAFAFWLYLTGLRTLPVEQAGIFLTLTPVFGVLGAMAALGEEPGVAAVAGGALVVGAIAAILKAPRADAPPGVAG